MLEGQATPGQDQQQQQQQAINKQQTSSMGQLAAGLFLQGDSSLPPTLALESLDGNSKTPFWSR
eukprot:1161129-Pelagomonas_calceolata.AAC.12